MGPFDSAWMKWFRGVLHSEAFESDIERFTANLHSQSPMTVKANYEAKRHGFVVTIDTLTPLPIDWPLRVGDIAHNFRSALDHLAWALVGRGATPPETLKEFERRRIALPVRTRPEKFSERVPSSLPGVRRADLAVLRRYQPYCKGLRSAPHHCLNLLEDFNSADKHRQLRVVGTVPVRAGWDWHNVRDCVVTDKRARALAVPIEEGAELRTILVRKTGPDPYLEVEMDLTTQVCIEQTPAVGWLDNTRAWIFALLKEFSDPPQSILNFGRVV